MNYLVRFYQKLLHDKITQTYKKPPKMQNVTQIETKSFAKTLIIEDKMECYSDHQKCNIKRPFETTLNAAIPPKSKLAASAQVM